MGAVIITVPVLTVQDGCTVTLTVGVTGTTGALFIITTAGEEIQPVDVLRTVTL